jgi:hypothetical protein
MKLPEDCPKSGPKHVAGIKLSQRKQLVWFICFYYCVGGQDTTTNHDTQQDANDKDTSTPSHAFMAWYLIKHRDISTTILDVGGSNFRHFM